MKRKLCPCFFIFLFVFLFSFPFAPSLPMLWKWHSFSIFISLFFSFFFSFFPPVTQVCFYIALHSVFPYSFNFIFYSFSSATLQTYPPSDFSYLLCIFLILPAFASRRTVCLLLFSFPYLPSLSSLMPTSFSLPPYSLILSFSPSLIHSHSGTLSSAPSFTRLCVALGVAEGSVWRQGT